MERTRYGVLSTNNVNFWFTISQHFDKPITRYHRLSGIRSDLLAAKA